MRRLLAFSVLVGLVSGAPLPGVADDEFSRCAGEAGRRVAAVAVRAVSREFIAIDNLQAANFELSVGKGPRTICGLAHVRQPSSVGILLDTSGSMSGGGCDTRGLHWSNPAVMVRTAIEAVLSTSGPSDEYFLVLANDRAALQCSFTRDLNRIRAGLQVTFKGKTRLTDGIYLALDEMRKARYSNRVLMVVSDGCDNTSAHRLRGLSETLSTLGVPLFFVTPNNPWDGSSANAFPDGMVRSSEAAARDDLFRVAEHSGGYAIRVPDKQQMLLLASQLPAVIRTPYLLYFQELATGGAAERGDVRIKVDGVRSRPILLYGPSTRYPLE